MKRYKIVIGALVSLVLIMAGFGIYMLMPRDTGPIPRDVGERLTFSPFVLPEATPNLSATGYKSITAENNEQILSYIIRTKDTTITVSQNAQPPQFAEIPEFKDQFLTNVAQQYDTVQTANGTMYLGRLTKQDNAQLAVMVERGLLVFLKPEKELDKAEWRNIGDSLEIQRVIN